jgi:(p)ppGpp synthase/HD superfamily hydrolase
MIRKEQATGAAGRSELKAQRDGGVASLFLSRSAPLRAAYAFAADTHSEQRQESDGSPYIEHPVAVARLLQRAGFGVDVVSAGLLHDTIESSDLTSDELDRRFGGRVSALVSAMTEPARPGDFRARKRAHREQIRAAGSDAAAIFAADKIANVQNLRRAVATQGEERVCERLSMPLAQKLEHYRATLEMLDGMALPLSLVGLLREELDAFDAERLRAA